MELAINTRELTGKKVATLRTQGLVPAVIYGKHLAQPIHITCDKNAFIKLYKAGGSSVAVTLKGEKIKELALIQDIQLDPVTDYVLHIDFHAVKADEKVTTSVPIVLTGISPIEKVWEGRVQLVKDTVEVEAFPQDLPKEITFDISGLDHIHQTVHVSDLTLSDKITILDEDEETIITVVGLIEEEVEEEATTDAAGNPIGGDDAEEAKEKSEEDKE